MNKESDRLFFSIIIPVYNRPDEIGELLQSLTSQYYSHFEVLIIEDGSTERCENIVNSFTEELDIRYFYKENSGQGFSRNYGFKKAEGDFFIIFDSDCLIPPHYLEEVEKGIRTRKLDAYGGPDKAHESFSALQKAISYSMTSPFTTGGIRGNKKHSGKFHPRSFNMGISRAVYEKVGGFKITRMGEDIEFSIRIINNGFKTGLISDAWVYHKRRTSLSDFYNQLHFFGRARINVGRFYPSEIKWIHLLPSIFVFCILFWLTLPFWQLTVFEITGIIGGGFFILLGAHATIKNKSLVVGVLSMATSFLQIFAYGMGFLSEFIRKYVD
ncbi:MAG TPA: glycosyltransferase [Balneolaceae bacterium]|nr:glycosyltransferase [Balneolaceae bacterium]